MNELLKGQRVYIKPEWQDKGDSDIDFRVVEDRGERVLIEARLPRFTIYPTHVVTREMIEARND